MSVDSEMLKLCNQWFIAVKHQKGSRWRNCLLLQRNWIYARYQDGTRNEAVKSGRSLQWSPGWWHQFPLWACTLRLNDVPDLFICNSAYEPKATFGLGSYTVHFWLWLQDFYGIHHLFQQQFHQISLLRNSTCVRHSQLQLQEGRVGCRPHKAQGLWHSNPF